MYHNLLSRAGRSVGRCRAHRIAYNHIERFLQAKYKTFDIPFSALDRSFIDKYDLYLRTEGNFAPGTPKSTIAVKLFSSMKTKCKPI